MKTDFRQMPHTHTDFQAAYDAEAKAVLRQVERDFAEKRSQILWSVITPFPQNSMKNREKSLNMLRIGSIFGLVFCIVAWWGIDEFLLNHQIQNEMQTLYYLMFVFFTAMFLLQFFLAHKLLPFENKPNYSSVAYIHLDFLRETVTFTSQQSRYPTIYSFHSKSMFPKIKLPAFRLPANERSEYSRLAENLQRKISELTGLDFKD